MSAHGIDLFNVSATAQKRISSYLDVFDTELVKIAKGEMPEIVDLVHRVMDGEKPDLSSLSKKEVDYVKTVRVLTGESLYSDSWLEI